MHSLDPASRTILIGCGKSKRTTQSRAEDLYTGSLFAARRRYAEATGCRWLIVSARYGLVSPAQLLDPYDLRIDDLLPLARAAWSLGVVSDFLTTLAESAKPSSVGIELHMGAQYFEPLMDVFGAVGIQWDIPTRGLSQGEQMAHYAREAKKWAS